MKRMKRQNYRKIDKQTKSDLPNHFKPMFKGLVLFFDDALLKRTATASGALVYSGLYFSVPKKARYASILRRDWVIFKKSKNELIHNLGIARSTFYEAIKELVKLNLITVDYDKFGRSFYKLHHNMELENSEIRAMVTTEMLRRTFVNRNVKQAKTYSPYAKIVLGLLAQESRKDYKRVVEITAKDISENFNIPTSTVYYLIRQFASNNTISLRRKRDAMLSLLLLDEYSQYQRNINKEMSGTYSTNRTAHIKNKVPEEEPVPDFIDNFMNS